MLKRVLRQLVRKGRSETPSAAPGDEALAAARDAWRRGDAAAARTLCDEALAASPRADVLILLAELELEAGDAEGAERACRTALQLDPRSGEANVMLARALRARGDTDAAMLALEHARNFIPGSPDLLAELGALHLQLGNLESAWMNLRNAVILDARAAGAWINLAIVEQRRGNLRGAVANFKRAVEANPQSGLAWSNYGLALRDAERLSESIDVLRTAARLRPRHAVTRLNLGSVLLDDDRVDEARQEIDTALALDPALAAAHVAAGLCRLRDADFAGARAAFEAALDVDGASQLARAALGELQVGLREFESGWKNYEARSSNDASSRLPQTPLWRGEEIGDGTLVVLAEQGVGDMVLFASCLRDAQLRAKRVFLEAPPKLLALFARSFPGIEVRPHEPRGMPQWLPEARPVAACIAAGSLMSVLRPSATSFPPAAPYLVPDAARVAAWRERLAAMGGGLKVALSWKGGFYRTGRKARSLTLEDLLPLLTIPGARFVSLQYTADAPAELAELERKHGVVVEHWTEAAADLDETAALIAACDLVVTVCTAAAHVAGALGRETWVLAPATPSWRYLLHGEDLPWYPRARVLRQQRGGQWATLIDAAAAELRARVPRGQWSTPAARINPLHLPRLEGQPAADVLVDDADGQDDALAEARRLQAAGDGAAAIAVLEDALAQSPSAPRYALLASLYAHGGQLESAHDCLELALHQDPQSVDALFLSARLLQSAGRTEEAVRRLERLLEVSRDSRDACCLLARLHNLAGRHAQAAKLADEVLRRWPNDAAAYNLLGAARVGLEDYAGAVDAIERFVALAPEMVGAHLDLGAAYLHCGRLKDAREQFEWVIAQQPNNPAARWDLSHLQLAAREFEDGWRNYEYRRQALNGIQDTAHLPYWRGEPLAGGSLLVLAEQGLGDQIMFASCLREAQARAGASRTIVTCEPRLMKLFARSFPGIDVVDAHAPDAWRGLDATREVLCGSLPGHFRRTAADFPRHDGYLVPDPQRVAWWKRRVGGGSNGPRIGLSWRGGTSQTRTSLRTLRLQELAPLLRIPGASFVSLQYGPSTADEVAALARDHGMPIVHFPEAIADYDETAALVCALDMVVTVCTSLVHLTGALGQKALVLTPAVAEWRYGVAGDDMPWYPSVRLVRQAPGEPWMEVVERATEDLDRTLRDQVRTGDEERHI